MDPFRVCDTESRRLGLKAVYDCYIKGYGLVSSKDLDPMNTGDNMSSKEVNSSLPGQNDRHFPDDIFKCIFLIEKFFVSIKISLKFVPKGPIDNKSVFV